MSRLRSTRLGMVSLVALLLVVTPALVAVDSAAAAGTVLKTHPHDGTTGSVPTAAAEGYSSRSGTAVAYTDTPAAADGTTSVRFAGTAATYFEDAGLSSSTGKLVWSAPVLVPSLPPSGSTDRFLTARSSSGALGSVEIAPSGRLQLRNGGGTLRSTGTFSLAAGTWYRAEALFQGGQLTVRVFDMTGALLGTVGPVAITAGTPSRLRTGLVVTGAPLLIDRVQIADDWLTDVAPPPPPPPPPPSPCGSLSGSFDPANPPQYDHVVVLMEENWSYQSFATSTAAPFLTQLSLSCGNETNFHAATHTSQPNYMAATSGIASAVGAQVANANLFEQLQSIGKTWRSYEESMPANCSGSSVAPYKPGHNPAYYYTDLLSPLNTCVQNDLPLDAVLPAAIATDSLPAFSWITPNLCHDWHWSTACTGASSERVSAGDAWLSNLIPQLTAMPSYQAGRTLIVVTFDEGEGGVSGVDCTDPAYYVSHPDCQIPTVVVSPYIAPGTTDATDLNLYSLLGTTEDILGVPRLGRAVGQPSMRATMPF
ncbi:MAG: alkaline phosphatase family protein [Oryzihumus sp.]